MIVLLGMVGAGKTAQASRLGRRHGWHWLSTGEVLRQSEDPVVRSYLDRGKLLPDEQMQELIVRELKKLPSEKQVIFDGFPRRISQAEWLESLLVKTGQSVGCAIHLTIDPATAQQRLKLRARHDDSQSGIETRMREYEDSVVPVVAFYKKSGLLDEINAVGTEDEVARRISNALRRRRLI